LLYIIPTAVVSAKVKKVPVDDRAGLGPEYVIENLLTDEFDAIEVE
jgi:hypothetical protein